MLVCERPIRTSNISNAQNACSSALYNTTVVREEIGSWATCGAHIRGVVRTIREMTLVVVWTWLTS